MSKIVIRNIATGDVEHEIDTTGKTERELEKIERELLQQMDTERFCFEVSA